MSTGDPAAGHPPDDDAAADSSFVIEDISSGPSAHGFGSYGGRDFAFQVRRTVLRLELYRAGRKAPVPGPEDVAAVAELPVTDVDLDDARSVTALVRDALAEAERTEYTAGQHPTVVRTLLGKLGSVIDGI
ncbi:hypothetical protein [Tomitella fengzijianii]|uniref:Uncharacterized protein n=1 Tax=Tomitella fengzijianii TaxID=2597660 RepID=A0A516X2U0_9ACTN|nr:hypothetical protein [Tomitella fengzijianii]QDQ97402.1 hypothetical protein FO059_08755 [Tomitella fengzijianii]